MYVVHTPPGGGDASYVAQLTPAHGSKVGKNGKNGKNGGAAGVELVDAAERALSPIALTAAILK